MSNIIAIVFFVSLETAGDWTEIHDFAKEQEKFLRKYLKLPTGIRSHDTIQRVFAMASEKLLQKWNGMLSSGEGEKVRKLLAIDGKTQRRNGTANQKANHIVSAVDEKGFCLAQKRVDEKSAFLSAVCLWT